MIQSLLYWLAASPDGLTTDESSTPIFGLIEIKCPFSKRNLHPQDMLNFYVELQMVTILYLSCSFVILLCIVLRE